MKIIVGFVLVILMCLNSVQAGSITLTQTASASILGNSLSVEIKLTNEGNVSAFNITLRVIMAGKNILLPTVSELKAGQSYSQTASTSLGDDINGEFHILSLASYEDDKNVRHVNSAQMYLNSVPIDEHPISLGIITETSDKTESRLNLIVSNSSVENILVKLQFIVPDGIALNRLSKLISLGESEEERISVILNAADFTKIGASSVYVIARYTIDEIQHSQIISSLINPEKEQSIAELFFSTQYYVFTFAGLFLLLLIYTIINNYRNKGK